MPAKKSLNASVQEKHPPTRLSPEEGPFLRKVTVSSLLDGIPLGVALIDRSRRIQYLNRTMEGMVGLSLEEARGLPCFQVLRSRFCMEQCVSCTEDISEPIFLESDLLDRSRKLIPIQISLSPLLDSKGAACGFIESVEDLRSRIKMEEKRTQAYSFGNIIGKSPQMEKLFRILPVIAQSDSSVLITGETGTGKDMIAEAIHQASGRAKGPFVKVNCGALPETLLESELFGHKKGAFTGAVSDKLGRFHLAHNGTLYLTEIGDLPLPLQVKLLTFLDDKTVFPLGSTKAFTADVRIIAATHHNLEQMVKRDRFRQDLFFRLNVLRLHIPPLRKREGDVRLLLDHFFHTFASEFDSGVKGLSAHALKILLKYGYPGNIRELKNIVEYAVNMCRGNRVFPKHLPSYLNEARSDHPPPEAETPPPPSERFEAAAAVPPPHAGETWPDMERRLIADALLKTRGNRRQAAARLGWARSTLWRKMKAYRMDR